jgi:uncharacterized protein DUF3592
VGGRSVFVQYARASRGLRAAVFVAVIGAVLAAFSVSVGIRDHRRTQDFYPAHATVLAKYRRGGGRGGPTYEALIRYLDRQGQPHVRRVAAARKEYLELRPGYEMPVYVSGLDPGDAWPASAGKPNYRNTALLGGCGAAAFLPLVIVLEWLRRRAAVLRNGQPLRGRVEKVGRDYRIRVSTKYRYQLRWSCTAPDGRRWRGKSLHFPKQLASQWKAGEEIDVYFDAGHPQIAEVDVYGLR